MALHVIVTPAAELIDVSRAIRVTGATPGSTVTLKAVSTRAGGSLWEASATFRADAGGNVDLTRDAPLEGSYAGCSAMGLIWSQEQVTKPTGPADGAASVAPVTTVLSAVSGGDEATATMEQSFHTPGVIRREVQEEGVCGALYLPEGPGPHPAVVILNGSGGGLNEPRAALYAARGYAALALGYFRCEGRPYWINDTPL